MRTAAKPQRSASPTPAPVSGRPDAITFITIPSPPSVNALYRNLPGRGRVKTGVYKDWAGHAGWTLKSQNPAPVPGRVVIVIGIERRNGAADIDNRAKAILDLLVAHKVIKNDNLVTAIAMAWAAKGTDLARVAVMPATDLTLDLLLATDGASGGWFLKAPEQEGPADDGN